MTSQLGSSLLSFWTEIYSFGGVFNACQNDCIQEIQNNDKILEW